MKNTILREGQLVKYFVYNKSFESCGFKLGQVYKVKDDTMTLYIEAGEYIMTLTDMDGNLVDNADYVKLHKCPLL